ncbi:hypothetical protein GOBAR_DD17756 [Gossypium barbadense]|nr:hypothetical protein GOBAR_DD17756 [Gossypium barbadense]
MEGRLFCFLLALQIVRWTCATSRPLAPIDGFGVHQPGQKNPEPLQVPFSSKEMALQSSKSKERSGVTFEEAKAEGVSKLGIGSSPQVVNTNAMAAPRVKPFKCLPQANESMWIYSTQIMSLRVGNASVVLPFTTHELKPRTHTALDFIFSPLSVESGDFS